MIANPNGEAPARFRRVHRVDEQIQEELFQLSEVSCDKRQVIVDL
jgi:hypothetical protein